MIPEAENDRSNPAIISMCGNIKNNKTSKITSCQADIDMAEPLEYKKYSDYALEVDKEQDDRAVEIKLCSMAKPHMMAFHCSWWGFFVAFFIWFAISPLLQVIRDDLKLSDKEIWTSSITSVAGTIFMRIVLGPACDKWGARIPMAVVLILCAIPTACTGFINGAPSLAIVRLFIGCAGGTFVMCQCWTSRMFAKEVAGTANALVGGWGNLGGGVTQLVVGTGLFPLFKLFFNGDSTKAWRTVSVVPALLAVITGITIYRISDDCPKGNYVDLKRHGSMQERSVTSFFRQGICNINTWILFLQYACCFGTELTINNAAALYFFDCFDLETESAAAIASIFGWLNLFARGLGGYCSDKASAQYGMRGRLWVQTGCLLAQGALALFFAQTTTLTSAVFVMFFFSLFVQASEGSTYGIVPYVDPPTTGAIAGIVGAGGNMGAVCFSVGFRQLGYKNGLVIMGYAALASAFLSALVSIKGHASMFGGKDDRRRRSIADELFTPYNLQEQRRGQNIDSSSSSSSSGSSHSDDEEDIQHLDGTLDPATVPNRDSSGLGIISAIIEEGSEEGSDAGSDDGVTQNDSGVNDQFRLKTICYKDDD